MGQGMTNAAPQMAAPPPPVDAVGQMIQARKSALRSIAAKQGLSSTLLTGPMQTQSSIIGGGMTGGGT